MCLTNSHEERARGNQDSCVDCAFKSENSPMSGDVSWEDDRTMSIDTRAVHAGYNPSACVVKGSVAPPLYMSNTYDRSCQNVS